MGTLGIGTVVNSLRGVDLGAATSKTLDAGARVWDITKAIGTKIWDNAKSFTQDAGIIMSHTWNSSPSQDEIKPTFIPSAEVQAPLPTLNLMEFSPAKQLRPQIPLTTTAMGKRGRITLIHLRLKRCRVC
jgi:3-dehydroquinate dehydratase